MRLAALVAVLVCLPAALLAQERRAGADSTRPAAPPPPPTRLTLDLPPELQPLGLFSAARPDPDRVARTWAEQLGQRLSIASRRALYGVPIAPADATGVLRGSLLPRPAAPTDAPAVVERTVLPPGANTPVADTTRAGTFAGLDIDLQTRIEARGERLVDHRCVPGNLNGPVAGCRTSLTPTVDLQFALKSAGDVAERFRVNVDFDSQREFDASNHLSVAYEGKPGSRLRRVELGNVAFATPSTRFLGAAVPAGNYGLQAEAQLGRWRLQAIAAQQKGTVARERQFMVGERTLQGSDREIEDWQIEPRRFFFAVDPRAMRGYPAIDILDRAQLTQIRAALPDTVRPTRLLVYRLQFGAPPQNPNAPRFRVQEEGRSTLSARQTYDVLREGVDYYADPSLLWFALVRPLNVTNERLVVAYEVRVNGRDTTWTTTGGTPDVEASDRDQVATLVWDPNVTPASPAFAREIRSVYRIGGSDLVRERTQVRVVAGSGSQEKPLAGTAETYLQMLGLAQPTNSAEFNVEQRLWPRRGDPVFNLAAGAGPAGSGGQAPLVVGDHFLVFPSLRPFAARGAEGGLVEPGNPANEAIYATPGEYLAFGSPRHPASVYRLLVRTDVEGSADRRTLMLGGVQLRRGSERIAVDGVVLARDVDYRVDYELGQVTFVRPDTLFARPRTVAVRFEENPLFTVTPTRLAGLSGQYTFGRGQLGFVAVSQAQASTFNRPQLGFERAAATMAGVTGSYSLPLAPLTRALARLPGGTTAPSRLDVSGELALSRPESRDRQQAYLESFEGEGGVQIPLASASWLLSSKPAYGRGEVARRYSGLLEEPRAAPLAWQTFVTG
ncbi:MAG TPA: cell surface protein SprA, partial [Gemmatimonadaceae bacterium]|nr:cell surface protein SprA [Gemmatimonadaceae bacterium]